MSAWPGVVAHYRSRLNLQGEPVTLLEGNTPLIESPRLAEWACPGARLFLKYEGLNPTGSFKDRGMTAAMTQAVYDGAQAVICASKHRRKRRCLRGKSGDQMHRSRS